MKFAFGLLAAIALSGATSTSAIRILSDSEAVGFLPPVEPDSLQPVSLVRHEGKPCPGRHTNGSNVWGFFKAYQDALTGTKRDPKNGNDHHDEGKHHHPHDHHHHKHHGGQSLFEHKTVEDYIPHHGVHVSTPSWMTMIYTFGGPRPSKFVGSDNADENAIVEAMLSGEGLVEGAEYSMDGEQAHGAHGWHNKHGNGRHGHGRAARCFKRRLMNAISSLRPVEAGILAFTVGAGLGSLLRIAFMLILLARRSHAYLNETVAEDSDAAIQGYPGAAYKAEIGNKSAEAETLLPAYSESEASSTEAVNEKAAIRSA